jgi:type VI secretion system secreted protein VgrG
VANYTQDNRSLSVTTPLGKDVLLLEAFTGTEGISRLFHFTLELLAQDPTKVVFEKLLGQGVTVTVLLPGNKKRYLHGIVSRLTQGGSADAATKDATFIRYRAEVVPSFWLLGPKRRSRIFQQLSVPDILKKVLAGLEVSYQIQGQFDPRDHCVQYQESDLSFASRLMEEEGIYYFFKHTSSGHQMVVADTPQGHADVPEITKAVFDESGEHRIYLWEKSQEIRPGLYTVWDYNFQMPDKHLDAFRKTRETVKAGSATHQLKLAGNDQMEMFDYPAGYAHRFDGVSAGGGDQTANLQKIFQDNTRTATIRMGQEACPAVVVTGASDCRQFTSGHKFTLDKLDGANGVYVLTRLEHSARMRGAYTSGGKVALEYRNSFDCLPLDSPFRPQRVTARPLLHGTQTATVVGPAGQEIFTDKYGRVKVQFRWDRDGKKDASSSCWVRVGTPWAGKQWGIVHVPRIGQEVIIAFEEGDPDRPIIIGSVYNAENMPPYTLPDNMTQSGVKSRSTTQGTTDNFNELRFEDKKGSEEVYFHAERNFTRIVENTDTLKVGSDKADDGSQIIEVYYDRKETVKTGNETVTIEKGGRTHSVKKDDSLTVGNNWSVTIQQGNGSIEASAGKLSLQAAQSITLTVGASSIKIEPQQVTITSPQITVQGKVQID